MSIECKGIAREKPDELASAEDDPGSSPDRFSEDIECTYNCLYIARLLVQNVVNLSLKSQVTDAEPNGGSNSKHDGCDDEGKVVAKLWNQGQRSTESTS